VKHEKLEEVAPASTTEAMENPFPRMNVERGGLLFMEGAQALISGPGLFERNMLGDQRDDVHRVFDTVQNLI
jgi:hypothetical protein